MKSYFSFLRRAVQLLFLGFFVWLLSKALWPLAEWPVDIFLRSDPLLALAIPLAARALVAKLVPGLIVIASALVLGRFFCGWLCPMGTTLDLAGLLFRRKNPEKTGPGWLRFMLLAFIAAAALLGANYAFWAAPIPLITRFYAIVLHPALLWSLDTAATHIPPAWLPDFAASFSFSPRGYDSALFVLLFFLLLFGLERFQPRFWCRNLCPAGAILALLAHKPLWRRRVRQCVSCGLCARGCPAQAISTKGLSSSHGDCLTCQRCVDICPKRGVFFRPRPTPLPLKILESQPGRLHLSRRAFLSGAALGLGGGLLHMGVPRLLPFPAAQKLAEDFAPPSLLRPPGALPEKDFLALCARCGECMKVCPTGALQAVWPGPAGLFSPTLQPRRGPCEPECNACGQVCPTGAVAPLALPEKRWAKIGTAVVKQESCLAWAEKRSCVVCQEVCPYGAVELQVTPGSAGIPVPVVRLDYCYGCGYCQYHCPVADPAIVIEPREALRLPGGPYQSEARARGLALDPLERAPAEMPPDQLPPGFLE